MAWNSLPAGTVQLFAGGQQDLDPYAKTMFKSNCGCSNTQVPVIDRLTNPLQFDRGLNHLSPTSGRETFNFGFGQQNLVNQQIINTINEVGVGAQFEIIAIPCASVITSLAVSVYGMDNGLVLSVSTRNGKPFPTAGRKFVVPATGCNPDIAVSTIASSALASIGTIASTSSSEHYVFYGPAVAGLTGNADVVTVTVAQMPQSGFVTNALNVEFDVSYDVILRLTR